MKTENLKNLFKKKSIALFNYLASPSLEHRYLFFYYSKALGCIFFIAFCSLAMQFNGLFSENGIVPITQALTYFKNNISWIHLPHIFFVSSDIFLWIVLCLAILASITLICGIFPMLSTGICWIIYVSFINTGSIFMSFQWDILLCEVAFFSIFAMPTCYIWKKENSYCPPRIFKFVAIQCCFRLVFFSGLVKLLSKDPTWLQLTALDVHYFTQPLPHLLSWLAHQLPATIDKLCVLIMFIIELIVPFFLFAGRKLRKYAALAIIGLMLSIMLTGNYCFFNALTIVLACFCFDDSLFNINPAQINKKQVVSFKTLRVISLSFILCIAIGVELNRFILMPSLQPILTTAQRFHIANNYGLFATMTTIRNELEIWASQDKKKWKAYTFKYKPNSSKDRPKFVLPHQPRLDWQCWFVSLRPFSQNSWVMSLIDRLFKKSKPVEDLFDEIAYEEPPKYLVLVLRNYEFSNLKQLRSTGDWWTVKEPIQFSPVFSNPYIK